MSIRVELARSDEAWLDQLERAYPALTERVRSALKRHITNRYATAGTLSVVLLDPSIEEAVRDSIQRTAGGSYLAMPPDLAREVLEAIRSACEEEGAGGRAVLLTQADVRRFVRRLVEVELPDVTVLSYQELAPEVTVQPLSRATL